MILILVYLLTAYHYPEKVIEKELFDRYSFLNKDLLNEIAEQGK